MIIDAHQHFWQLSRGDYDWLTPDIATLYRDFMPNDLTPILRKNGVDGTILVQAAPTVAETEFLLEIADNNPFVRGVVGWVDFESTRAPQEIARLAKHSKLVGLRPMIQDIADDKWMLRTNLAPAFGAMITADLTFDALILSRHLPHLRQLLGRHPKLRTVIDHAAKPNIADSDFTQWATDIAVIANESGSYCKLSGLLTEAGTDWSSSTLSPYFAHLFEHFGSERLIWGSDWPVLTSAASYEAWMNLVRLFLPDSHTANAVLGANASHLYRLKDS